MAILVSEIDKRVHWLEARRAGYPSVVSRASYCQGNSIEFRSTRSSSGSQACAAAVRNFNRLKWLVPDVRGTPGRNNVAVSSC